MKWFSSLLAAVGIYAGLLGVVLYSYAHYHSRPVTVAAHKREVITLGIIGESGKQSAASKKPTSTPSPTPKSKETKPNETKTTKPAPEKRTKLPTAAPLQKIATQKSPHKQSVYEKNIPKKILTKRSIVKEIPIEPNTAPIPPILSPISPKQKIALKSIPAEERSTTPTKKRIKKKRVKKRKVAHRRQGKYRQQGKKARAKRPIAKKRGRGSGHRRRQRGDANRFLATLKQRINRHNHYPRIAKRRGLQGHVQASFTILPNGSVTAISIRGADAFHAAARRAVQGAFPVNPSKAGHRLPWRITVTLRYRLKGT